MISVMKFNSYEGMQAPQPVDVVAKRKIYALAGNQTWSSSP
jgi:hypothetical protein